MLHYECVGPVLCNIQSDFILVSSFDFSAFHQILQFPFMGYYVVTAFFNS